MLISTGCDGEGDEAIPEAQPQPAAPESVGSGEQGTGAPAVPSSPPEGTGLTLQIVQPPSAASAAPPTSMATPGSTRRPMELRTTSSSIILRNLNGRIESTGRSWERQHHPIWGLTYAGEVQQRASILGRMADREIVAAVAEEIVSSHPEAVGGLMLRAGQRAYFHRFEEALADLEHAQELGAEADEVDALRAEILWALGRSDESIAIIERLQPESTSLYIAAALANARFNQGRVAEAEQLFARAPSRYTDTHPLPLAWLHVQHGVITLRQGDYETAKIFFESAHERLPEFFLATEHLAETEALLGNTERAAELYRQVCEQTEAPEFFAALAGVEAQLGHSEASEEAYRRAEAGFEALLASHPAAAWQHAAQFYLDRGQVQRAAELARLDVELRPNVMALLLLADAEQEAGNRAEACAAWARAVATGMHPPELEAARPRFEGCGPER